MYFPEDPTCYFWEKAYITPSVFTKGKLFFNRWIEEAVINTYYYTDSYPWMNIDAFFHWFRHSFRLFMIFFINFQCFDLFTGIKMFGLLFIHFFWFVFVDLLEQSWLLCPSCVQHMPEPSYWLKEFVFPYPDRILHPQLCFNHTDLK